MTSPTPTWMVSSLTASCSTQQFFLFFLLGTRRSFDPLAFVFFAEDKGVGWWGRGGGRERERERERECVCVCVCVRERETERERERKRKRERGWINLVAVYARVLICILVGLCSMSKVTPSSDGGMVQGCSVFCWFCFFFVVLNRDAGCVLEFWQFLSKRYFPANLHVCCVFALFVFCAKMICSGGGPCFTECVKYLQISVGHGKIQIWAGLSAFTLVFVSVSFCLSANFFYFIFFLIVFLIVYIYFPITLRLCTV